MTTEISESEIYANIDAAIEEAGIIPESKEADQVDEKPAQNKESESTEALGEYAEPDDVAIAAEKGWKPKDQYEGDPSKWVDAAEFNRRTELFDRIGTISKENKDLKRKLDLLANHTKTVEEKTRERVLAELKAKQREAVSLGDEETFDAVDKQIEEIKKQELPDFEAEVKPEEPKQGEVPQVVKDFAERNKWFEKDREMSDFMVFKTETIIRRDNLPLEEAMKLAEAEVKKTFAHKFVNPKKNEPSRVMSNSNESRPAKLTLSSLTSEQRSVWHALKGSMTEQEFLSQLESIA